MTASKQEAQRQTILHLWRQNVRKASEIQLRTGIPIATIYRNLKKLENKGEIKYKKGNGRPRKIVGDISKALGQYLRRDSSLSSKTLAIKLAEKGISVSPTTIQRHLHSLGYQNNIPLATPMLTSDHKKKRVEWAREHLEDDWETTIFTDETAFQLFRNTIRRWYKGARPIRAIPKDRTKILAWGGFCANGKTSLFCFNQIMDAEFYVKILRNHIPEVTRMLGHEWRFQQDNDPKHTSRLAKAFLKDNVPQTMTWPSNSPDLNPIENLWGIVKKNVEKRMPKNRDELMQFMNEEWQNIPESVIKELIRSMRRRCELVIRENGERISY